MVRKYIFPILLAVFLVLMVVMFLFDDLGIVASYKKMQKIYSLQEELRFLQNKHAFKAQLLKKLRKDPATIRHYALLYGMRGGQKVKGSVPRTDDLSFRSSGYEAQRRAPFLIRHPFLILLALTISVMLVVFVLMNRRKGVVRSDGRSVQTLAGRRSESRCIKPSWN